MISLKKYLKYLLTIVEASSISLLLLIFILVLSGYGILYPAQIRVLTGGLISERLAYKIHTDKIIRMSTITLLFIHGYSGILLLIERRVRRALMKRIMILCITILIVYLYILLVLLDLLR